MRLMKRLLIFVLAIGVILMSGGCRMDRSQTTKRNIVYKERDEIEADVKSYLSEKYGKEFVVAVSDNPNHIYYSYEVSAYAADDESKTLCTVSITYVDEENYSITDDYFMYSISEDLEVWFKELADPYIDCEYKAFWRPSPMQLSSEYNECKNLEDFLDVSSKASSYYVLRFLIVLPSQAVDCDIIAMTKSISSAMQEKRIRGHITMRVYVDDVVYDQIKSKKDQRHFWTHQYRNIFCTFAVEKDFNITEVDKFQKGGFWHLDDETYNKEILNNN